MKPDERREFRGDLVRFNEVDAAGEAIAPGAFGTPAPDQIRVIDQIEVTEISETEHGLEVGGRIIADHIEQKPRAAGATASLPGAVEQTIAAAADAEADLLEEVRLLYGEDAVETVKRLAETTAQTIPQAAEQHERITTAFARSHGLELPQAHKLLASALADIDRWPQPAPAPGPNRHERRRAAAEKRRRR